MPKIVRTSSLLLGILILTASHADEHKTVVNPEHLMDTTQYGFSQAVIVPPGAPIVYVAGQIGIADSGPNDFRSQVDRSFENLAAVLAASGSSPKHVVKVTLLVKDISEEKLAYLIKKRRSFFDSKPPASTLIPVPELALPSLAFEIDAIAVATE